MMTGCSPLDCRPWSNNSATSGYCTLTTTRCREEFFNTATNYSDVPVVAGETALLVVKARERRLATAAALALLGATIWIPRCAPTRAATPSPLRGAYSRSSG